MTIGVAVALVTITGASTLGTQKIHEITKDKSAEEIQQELKEFPEWLEKTKENISAFIASRKQRGPIEVVDPDGTVTVVQPKEEDEERKIPKFSKVEEDK